MRNELPHNLCSSQDFIRALRKENEGEGTFRKHEGIYKMLLCKLKLRDHFDYQETNGRIILKEIFKKEGECGRSLDSDGSDSIIILGIKSFIPNAVIYSCKDKHYYLYY